MKNLILKNNIKTISLCFIALFMGTQNTMAQNTILGFKNVEKQNKLEKDFDAQLNAGRVGQNIKLLSSVPHHVGSVGGKFVSDQIIKIFKEAGWDVASSLRGVSFSFAL